MADDPSEMIYLHAMADLHDFPRKMGVFGWIFSIGRHQLMEGETGKLFDKRRPEMVGMVT